MGSLLPGWDTPHDPPRPGSRVPQGAAPTPSRSSVVDAPPHSCARPGYVKCEAARIDRLARGETATAAETRATEDEDEETATEAMLRDVRLAAWHRILGDARTRAGEEEPRASAEPRATSTSPPRVDDAALAGVAAATNVHDGNVRAMDALTLVNASSAARASEPKVRVSLTVVVERAAPPPAPPSPPSSPSSGREIFWDALASRRVPPRRDDRDQPRCVCFIPSPQRRRAGGLRPIAISPPRSPPPPPPPPPPPKSSERVQVSLQVVDARDSKASVAARGAFVRVVNEVIRRARVKEREERDATDDDRAHWWRGTRSALLNAPPSTARDGGGGPGGGGGGGGFTPQFMQDTTLRWDGEEEEKKKKRADAAA